MFHNSDIVADGLPPGTLCLTYDDGPGEAETSRDGPGPRTAELGAFLASQGVAATFFAVGKFAATSGAILARLLSLGHLVANHTFDHPSLPAFVARGGDVIDQLARTNLAIGPYDQGSLTFFRAPYGDWRLRGQPLSNVARVLNRSALSSSFVGPIGWDIDAGDVGFWRDGRSADDCGLAYLEAIQSAGRGIILMHDSTADIDEIRTRNQALALAQWLVPRLRRRGFRFVRLDEIPQVVSAMKVTRQLVLASHDGDYLSAPRGSTRIMMNSRAGVDASAIWGVVDLGNNHLALRSTGGRFLSAHVDGQVCADSLFIGEREIFTVESRPSGVALRTNRAAYVAPGTHQDVRLSACGVSGTFLAIDPYHPEGMTNPDFVRRSPSIQ